MSTAGELNAMAKSLDVFKSGRGPAFEPKPLPRSTGFGCCKCDRVEQDNSILILLKKSSAKIDAKDFRSQMPHDQRSRHGQ